MSRLAFVTITRREATLLYRALHETETPEHFINDLKSKARDTAEPADVRLQAGKDYRTLESVIQLLHP